MRKKEKAILRAAASLAIAGGVISQSTMVFFRPTEKFFEYFSTYQWKWRRFHDCGAGSGCLTREMNRRKLETSGYDLFPREEGVAEVERFDTTNIAERMDWSEVAILARPCHGPGFIDGTIDSALEMGEAFYVGLEKNFEHDLSEFERDVVCEDVGEDGESLIRIRCRKGDGHIYRRIINSGRKEWWWYSPSRRRYVSEPGGLSGFTEDDVKVKVLEEQRWANDLQTTLPKEEMCDDNKLVGWLAPDGEWFGCGQMMHDRVARLVLGCSVRRLEAVGFCRCYGEVSGRMMWTHGDESGIRSRKPNPAQKRVLKAKGYDLRF